MSTNAFEYYNLLNVAKDASAEEIKKAFRALAHKFHPDKNSNKDAEEKFKEISKAYEVLINPETRSLYDRTGIDDYNKFRNSEFGGNPFANFNGFHGRGMGCGFGRGCGFRNFHNNRMGNFFKNEIAVHNISISAEEASKGIEISVKPGNTYLDKAVNIKLPGGIQDGAVIRCIDQNYENEFYIKINYT
ncbi:MAG: DnaJ domain-containing protein [Spirochaetota bacterium]